MYLLFVGSLDLPLWGKREQENKHAFDSSLLKIFKDARCIADIEQPGPELTRLISAAYTAHEAGAEALPRSIAKKDVIVINDVPFFPYWQSREKNRYVFHPMAYAWFLLLLSHNEKIETYVNVAVQTAHPLPNGGILWYYPNNYKLNRFLGPDLSPSAISQGQFLADITAIDEANPDRDLSEIAHRVYRGLAFDYYKGGVNLENKALLEVPLFRSAPEIILNGWLHAILGLSRYVEYYQDSEAEKLLMSNVIFLSEVLGHFDDPKTGLSCYSDLCPYRVKIRYTSKQTPEFTVFYKARIDGFDNMRFELKTIDHPTISPYDNQVVRRKANFSKVWISCSRNYDTYIVSESCPFTCTFDTGTHIPTRSTPGKGGEQVKLSSTFLSGSHHVVHVTSVRDRLFCGYPTNFSKKGSKNYYHIYHVVALACILTSMDLPKPAKEHLQTYMNRWIETVNTFNLGGKMSFNSYQVCLNSMIKNGVWTGTNNWESILTAARTR